jgi:hypothetical protein
MNMKIAPLELSEHDKQNVDRIIGGYGDWFSADLIRLISRSDFSNRERFRVMFPEHVAAWEKWYRGDDN